MSSPFDELIEKLKNPGDEALPENIYDDLTEEYKIVLTGSQETIRTRDEKIAKLEKDNATLKSKNYDLLIASSNSGEEIEIVKNNDDNEYTIESLFTKRK